MGNKRETPFFAKAKDFFTGAWQWFAELFTQVDEWVDTVGVQVILFVEGLNKAIQKGTESGNLLDYIVTLIPGQLDDTVLQFLREKLPVVLAQLELIVDSDIFNDGDDDQKSLQTALIVTKLQNPLLRQMFMRAIATELAGHYIKQVGVDNPQKYQTDTLVSISFARLKQAGVV